MNFGRRKSRLEASRNADLVALWRQHHAANWAQMKIRMDEATLANGDFNKVPRTRW